jgi:hypothetical protein
MSPARLSSHPASLLGLLVLVALAAVSCDKKKSIVLPADGVEGVASASQLVVWPDTPTEVATYDDFFPFGPSPEDTLQSVLEFYGTGPGTILGMIFDFTDADRFEVLRREGSTFRRLKDFTLYPSKRFFHGHTDVFRFMDQRPGPVSLNAYVARGLVDGAGVAMAPKTNIGEVAVSARPDTLDYTAPKGIPPDFRPMTDSLLFMQWAPVPGAVGYWVHIYQFTDQGGDEIILSGTAAPAYIAVTRDYFLAFMPASVTSYKIGDPVPNGVHIATQRTLINGQQYLVRVAAVDASGRLIALTSTNEAYGVFRGEGNYRVFPLSAALVEPKAPTPPPIGTEPARALASNPRLSLYPSRPR